MLSSSGSPSPTARSSLEEMLESIRRRDEKPKDLPPALPFRPISKARLPSARRSLPTNFKVGGGGGGGGEAAISSSLNCYFQDNVAVGKEGKKRDHNCMKENVESGFGIGGGSFRSTKISMIENGDSEGNNKGSDGNWVGNRKCLLKKDFQVWCLLSSGQWKSGKIQSTLEEDAKVMLSDGSVLTVPTGNILPANPDILEDIDDLTRLSFLNEPSILHNLCCRYSQNKTYTKAGPVLVAMNAFKGAEVPGNEFLTGHGKKLMDAPSVTALSNTVFNEMLRDEVNQSIIISGESGAGKTETAKIVVRCLAALGSGNVMEQKILQSHVILEAFGHAKTSKNSNASRFGKLVGINFSPAGKICGANIQTFLLEKSRVIQMAKGERSFHVFYQLCAGAPSSLKERLNLKAAKDYSYLRQSDGLTIDNVDDAPRFHMLVEALDNVQIRKEDQENAFSVISAVLWLGNICFQVIDVENHVQVVADEAVSSAAKLIGCDVQDLMSILSTHQIQAGNNNVVQKLTLPQAIEKRDALAKFMYSSLFDWLVEQINLSLEVDKQKSGKSISILDICGFESFQTNGFEQFCINYANEKLRQHLNHCLFKLEQEEYAQDGIDWKKVDFEDNKDCLNLIEKPGGLLDLLDEETYAPEATDLTFAGKLKQNLLAYPCIEGERPGSFSIRHYAREVFYSTNGFLEKNRDPLHSDSLQLLSSCSCQLLQLFVPNVLKPSRTPASSLWLLHGVDSQKRSVVSKFKDQLCRVMQCLESTKTHFICCIKPNNKQLPGMFEKDLVLQQLRCHGILEIVRLSRSGYATRITHQQFARRYGLLLLKNAVSQDALIVSIDILQHVNIHPDMYQVGYSKLFFRVGQIAALEEARARMLWRILVLQKLFRGRQARCHVNELKSKISRLQSFIRGENARKEYGYLIKRLRAASLIQKSIRGWLVRKNYKMQKLLKSNLDSTNANKWPVEKNPERKQEHVQERSSIVAELQRQVLKSEAALVQKEEENFTLQQQLKQLEMKWLEYEAKMKTMEETWQKQIISLQTSLGAARRNPMGEEGMGHPGRPDTSPMSHYYDCDDAVSMGTHTPGGSTPGRVFNRSSDAVPARDANGNASIVNPLVKEFEHQKQVFEDDARFLVEVKSRMNASTTNPADELNGLKLRFKTWKKEYKVKLRDTKSRLNKLGYVESEKTWKTWWGKRYQKK